MSDEDFVAEMQQTQYQLFDWLDSLLQLVDQMQVTDLKSAESFNVELGKVMHQINKHPEQYESIKQKFQKHQASYVPGAILNLTTKGAFFNKTLALFSTLDGFRD